MATSPDSVTYAQTQYGVMGVPTVYNAATAAGTTQSDAYIIRDDFVVFTTVPWGSGAVLTDRNRIIVENRGANHLKVYPISSRQIEGYGVDVAVTITPNGSATFERVSDSLVRVR